MAALGLAVTLTAAIVVVRGSVPPDYPSLERSPDTRSVTAVHIDREPYEVTVALVGDRWWVSDPVRLPADGERVRQLLDAWNVDWTTSRVVAPGPTPEEAEAVGLGAKRLDVRLDSGGRDLLRIEVGTPTEDGLWHVRVGGGRTIYAAEVPGLSLMSPRPERWSEPGTFVLAPKELVSLVVLGPRTRGEATFAWRRLTWSHEGHPLPVEQIPSWLVNARTAFASLDARLATDEEASDLAVSLEAPRVSLVLEMESLGTLRLDVGASTPDGGAITRIGDSPSLYVIRDHEVERMQALLPAAPFEGVPRPPQGPPLAP